MKAGRNSSENILFEKAHHTEAPPERCVKVTIRDSGIGMPEELLSKIFDPFFTTKEMGHGLGLSTCHSIVTRVNEVKRIHALPSWVAETLHRHAAAAVLIMVDRFVAPIAARADAAFERRTLASGAILFCSSSNAPALSDHIDTGADARSVYSVVEVLG